ncbi:MAG TPA: thioredoxin domain-containing protein [Candidatus Paceibacterota bacterium]
MENNQQKQIASAVIIAGVLIAGAILLKGTKGTIPTIPNNNNTATAPTELAPVSSSDRVLGNANAPVTVIEYADFQCPFCGRFHQDAEQAVINTYVNTGKVKFVYRDYAFLGPESGRAAEAARCAGDQGKFWEYHGYLYSHQNGENRGAFSDPNLKSFAKTLGLNTSTFNSCLDSGKHAQEVADSTVEGSKAGVTGTPKGFILRDGEIVSTIDGAEPSGMVIPKIEAALK